MLEDLVEAARCAFLSWLGGFQDAAASVIEDVEMQLILVSKSFSAGDAPWGGQNHRTTEHHRTSWSGWTMLDFERLKQIQDTLMWKLAFQWRWQLQESLQHYGRLASRAVLSLHNLYNVGLIKMQMPSQSWCVFCPCTLNFPVLGLRKDCPKDKCDQS